MATKEPTVHDLVSRREFNFLLDDISNRVDAIRQSNATTIDPDNVRFGLEMIENYTTRLFDMVGEAPDDD